MAEDESNLPVASFWTGHPMTREEAQQRYAQVKPFWHEETMTAPFWKLLRQGGGFAGIGMTDAPQLDWPRRVLVSMPPMPGYWNEEGKQRLLQTLDEMYAIMKQEIENA